MSRCQHQTDSNWTIGQAIRWPTLLVGSVLEAYGSASPNPIIALTGAQQTNQPIAKQSSPGQRGASRMTDQRDGLVETENGK